MSPCRIKHIMRKIINYEREIRMARLSKISAEDQRKRVLYFQGLINQCEAMIEDLKGESVDPHDKL